MADKTTEKLKADAILKDDFEWFKADTNSRFLTERKRQNIMFGTLMILNAIIFLTGMIYILAR